MSDPSAPAQDEEEEEGETVSTKKTDEEIQFGMVEQMMQEYLLQQAQQKRTNSDFAQSSADPETLDAAVKKRQALLKRMNDDDQVNAVLRKYC